MSSPPFSELIAVNLQYSGIKITKQCYDVNCVIDLAHVTPYSEWIRGLTLSLHIQSKCRKKLYNQDSITKKFCNIKILYIKNSINKNYKKAISNISKTINEQGKKMANKKNILDRIQVNGKEECFVTLKDHKPSFENNATARLINLAKN